MTGEAADSDLVGAALDGAKEVQPREPDPTPPSLDGTGRPRPPGGIRALPPSLPVKPLGTHGDVYYFLDAKNQLAEIKAEKMGRLRLLSLFDRDMDVLWRFWPKLDKTGAVVNWATEAVQEDLMASAGKMPIFNPMKRLRGVGGWQGDHGELIFHCGDRLYRSQGTGNGSEPPPPGFCPPGRIEGYVYPADEPSAAPGDGEYPPGDNGPAGELLALLNTWQWRRGNLDAMLLLGWICAAMLGAAPEWRPMVWLTGDAFTGKSTVHKLLKLVLADALLSVTDATAAGVWQAMGYSSLPVALDEIEADFDNRKAQGIIKLARDAASGGLTARGGQDHKGVQFTVKACFFFSSILIPPLLPQDRSRMAILDLERLPAGMQSPVLNPMHWRQVGAGLRARLAKNWWRWESTLEAYRMALADQGHSARGCDQFGTLLAAADLAYQDEPPTPDELDAWARRLKPEDCQDDTADHDQFLEYLRTKVPDAYRATSRRQMGDIIAQARSDVRGDLADDSASENNAVLASYGLRVLTDRSLSQYNRDWENRGRIWVAVANSHQGLAELFAASHWASRPGTSGVWVQAARRVEIMTTGKDHTGKPVPELRKAVVWKKTVRFGAVSARCTLLPMEAVLPGDG